MLRVRAVVVGGFAVSLVACASVLGIDDPIIDQDASVGDGDADAAIDATGGGDAHVDGAPLGDGGGDGGPIDGAMLDSGLDARDGDAGCPTTMADSAQVFVDSNATSDAGACGAMTMPCKTIQAGLDRAQSLGKTIVYVAAGSYIEAITLHAGIKVQGGWEVSGTTWSPSCNDPIGRVTITAPATSNTTVIASSVGGVTLDTLTIKSKATPAPGESIYGVFVSGSTTLVLNDVDVIAGNAGSGSPGSIGVDGGNATGDCLPVDDGATPANGAPGPAADAGSFASTGYVAPPAGSGNAGAVGHHGMAGDAGTCATCVTCGGALCTAGAAPPVCGQPGAVGCGGLPGSGGSPGMSGGSSIGVFVSDATVTVTGSTLHAGNGGNGGNGGPPGIGGAGSRGSTGSAGNSCTTACNGNPLACGASATGAGTGGAGSLGGKGSAGGAGGGGAGGWSCGYVKIGTAVVTLDGNSSAVNANPGSGQGGAPNGMGLSKCP